MSGSIAGSYASVGVRVGAIGLRRPVRALRPRPAIHHSNEGANGLALPAETRLELAVERDDVVRLTLYASGAATVEISGDFTDWEPVALHRSATQPDAWEGSFRIARGVHRINARRDGGPWLAPAGTTRRVDDFDGEVGVFLLP